MDKNDLLDLHQKRVILEAVAQTKYTENLLEFYPLMLANKI